MLDMEGEKMAKVISYLVRIRIQGFMKALSFHSSHPKPLVSLIIINCYFLIVVSKKLWGRKGTYHAKIWSYKTSQNNPYFYHLVVICIIAYATSLAAALSGDYITEGILTKTLCNNLQYDVSISSILDMTWNDVVEETCQKLGQNIQGPHYVSSVGSLFLRGQFLYRNN